MQHHASATLSPAKAAKLQSGPIHTEEHAISYNCRVWFTLLFIINIRYEIDILALQGSSIKLFVVSKQRFGNSIGLEG